MDCVDFQMGVQATFVGNRAVELTDAYEHYLKQLIPHRD